MTGLFIYYILCGIILAWYMTYLDNRRGIDTTVRSIVMATIFGIVLGFFLFVPAIGETFENTSESIKSFWNKVIIKGK